MHEHPTNSKPKSASLDGVRPNLLEAKEAIDRLGGRFDLYAETIGMFLDEVDQHLQAIQAAVEAQDFTTVHRQAHALKGFARMCGTVGVATVSETIDQVSEDSKRRGELPHLVQKLAEQINAVRPLLLPYRSLGK